ncbi:MAG TPA: hypothetical protein VES36_03635, partial [Candidatus Limnocylindrales bacterium]|nr:hypothetical protein [Candidatus Limnocylindrales bacterium]
RQTIHFLASFDLSGSPGGSLQAEVGQISVIAPPTEFIVVPADGGGGQLKIHDSGTQVQATLLGTFKTVFKGSKLDTSWSMRASQADSPFVVRLVDDSDSGMIDASFGGNGTIVVGGQEMMPYVAGTTYHFALMVAEPIIGPATWAVLVTAEGPGAPVGTALGLLPSTGPLTVKSVHLIRPAGASSGQFFVDDLKAVSSNFSVK